MRQIQSFLRVGLRDQRSNRQETTNKEQASKTAARLQGKDLYEAI